jgi:hypothetical protein
MFLGRECNDILPTNMLLFSRGVVQEAWSSFGKSISVFVSKNCFREQKQKIDFCCFFVKKVFGKLFLKTVSGNRKQ